MSLEGAKLICLDETGNYGEIVMAKGRKFTLGYYVNCDLVLIDERAKGVHCEIECDAFGRVTIRNLSPDNPILVNGSPVEIKRFLLNNSRLSVLDKEYLWVFSKNSTNESAELSTEDASSTPQKQIGIPEQPSNSCPDFKLHRELPKRFTVHNFAYCIQSDEEGNISSCSNNESIAAGTHTGKNEISINENKDEIGNESEIVQAVTKDRQNRCVTPEVSTENETSTSSSLLETPKVNLINCTKDKENKSTEKKHKQLLTICQQSDVLITSFSPRETGVKIAKSFVTLVKPKVMITKTPSKPRSKSNEIDEDITFDLIDLNTPSTSKNDAGIIEKSTASKVLKNSSMYLIDFTTPIKLRPASPYLKSALKTSTKKNLLQVGDKTSGIGSKLTLEEQVSARTVVSNPAISESNNSSLKTPSSVISVSSVDNSSVIEISSDSLSVGVTPLSSTSLKTPKKLQSTVESCTPKRTPQSLMKRALLTSAKKLITTPQTVDNKPTTSRKDFLNRIPLRSCLLQTPVTPQVTTASDRTRSMSAPTRKSISARNRFENSPSTSKLATTTTRRSSLNPISRVRNLPTSTPMAGSKANTGLRNRAACKTSPLHRVRKSISGIPLSSHISKGRKSIVLPASTSKITSIKEKSPQQIMSKRLVYRARNSLCISPISVRTSQMMSSSSKPPAQLCCASKEATQSEEKLLEHQKSVLFADSSQCGGVVNQDLSRTFVIDSDEEVENDKKSIEKNKPKDATFSPVKKDKSISKGVNISRKEGDNVEVPVDVDEISQTVKKKHQEYSSGQNVFEKETTTLTDIDDQVQKDKSIKPSITEESFAEVVNVTSIEDENAKKENLIESIEISKISSQSSESQENFADAIIISEESSKQTAATSVVDPEQCLTQDKADKTDITNLGFGEESTAGALETLNRKNIKEYNTLYDLKEDSPDNEHVTELESTVEVIEVFNNDSIQNVDAIQENLLQNEGFDETINEDTETRQINENEKIRSEEENTSEVESEMLNITKSIDESSFRVIDSVKHDTQSQNGHERKYDKNEAIQVDEMVVFGEEKSICKDAKEDNENAAQNELFLDNESVCTSKPINEYGSCHTSATKNQNITDPNVEENKDEGTVTNDSLPVFNIVKPHNICEPESVTNEGIQNNKNISAQDEHISELETGNMNMLNKLDIDSTKNDIVSDSIDENNAKENPLQIESASDVLYDSVCQETKLEEDTKGTTISECLMENQSASTIEDNKDNEHVLKLGIPKREITKASVSLCDNKEKISKTERSETDTESQEEGYEYHPLYEDITLEGSLIGKELEDANENRDLKKPKYEDITLEGSLIEENANSEYVNQINTDSKKTSNDRDKGNIDDDKMVSKNANTEDIREMSPDSKKVYTEKSNENIRNDKITHLKNIQYNSTASTHNISSIEKGLDSETKINNDDMNIKENVTPKEKEVSGKIEENEENLKDDFENTNKLLEEIEDVLNKSDEMKHKNSTEVDEDNKISDKTITAQAKREKINQGSTLALNSEKKLDYEIQAGTIQKSMDNTSCLTPRRSTRRASQSNDVPQTSAETLYNTSCLTPGRSTRRASQSNDLPQTSAITSFTPRRSARRASVSAETANSPCTPLRKSSRRASLSEINETTTSTPKSIKKRRTSVSFNEEDNKPTISLSSRTPRAKTPRKQLEKQTIISEELEEVLVSTIIEEEEEENMVEDHANVEKSNEKGVVVKELFNEVVVSAQVTEEINEHEIAINPNILCSIENPETETEGKMDAIESSGNNDNIEKLEVKQSLSECLSHNLECDTKESELSCEENAAIISEEGTVQKTDNILDDLSKKSVMLNKTEDKDLLYKDDTASPKTSVTSGMLEELVSTPLGIVTASDNSNSAICAAKLDKIPEQETSAAEETNVENSLKTLTEGASEIADVQNLVCSPKEYQKHGIDENEKIFADAHFSEIEKIETECKQLRTLLKEAEKENAENSPKTPHLKGVRELLKTPRTDINTPNFIGVRYLVQTPKMKIKNAEEEIDILTAAGNLMNNPKDSLDAEEILEVKPSTSKKSNYLKGVKELLKTPASCVTPRFKGMRELWQTPKISLTPHMGGIKELMQSSNKEHEATENLKENEQKITESVQIDNEIEEAAAVDILQKTETVDKSETDLVFVDNTDNTRSLELRGGKELLKITKNASTPRLKGIRELMKTPKVCSTPLMDGIQELLAESPAQQQQEVQEFDKFLRTPTAKNLMIPGMPSSAVIEKSSDSIEISTEYDLNATNEGPSSNLEDLFKTPVASCFAESITHSYYEEPAENEKLAEAISTNKNETLHDALNKSAEEAFDKLIGHKSQLQTPVRKTYNRKSALGLETPQAQSPFTAADVLSDLPKTDVEEWIETLGDAEPPTMLEYDDNEITEETSQEEISYLENFKLQVTADESIIPETCTKVYLSEKTLTNSKHTPKVNVETKDPLANTASNLHEKFTRAVTPIEADISGINLLDQTIESVSEVPSMLDEPLVVEEPSLLDEPLMVSDDESEANDTLNKADSDIGVHHKEEVLELSDEYANDLSEPLILSDSDETTEKSTSINEFSSKQYEKFKNNETLLEKSILENVSQLNLTRKDDPLETTGIPTEDNSVIIIEDNNQYTTNKNNIRSEEELHRNSSSVLLTDRITDLDSNVSHDIEEKLMSENFSATSVVKGDDDIEAKYLKETEIHLGSEETDNVQLDVGTQASTLDEVKEEKTMYCATLNKSIKQIGEVVEISIEETNVLSKKSVGELIDTSVTEIFEETNITTEQQIENREGNQTKILSEQIEYKQECKDIFADSTCITEDSQIDESFADEAINEENDVENETTMVEVTTIENNTNSKETEDKEINTNESDTNTDNLSAQRKIDGKITDTENKCTEIGKQTIQSNLLNDSNLEETAKCKQSFDISTQITHNAEIEAENERFNEQHCANECVVSSELSVPEKLCEIESVEPRNNDQQFSTITTNEPTVDNSDNNKSQIDKIQVTKITAPADEIEESHTYKANISTTLQQVVDSTANEHSEVSVIESDPEVEIGTMSESVNKEYQNIVIEDDIITNEGTATQVTEIRTPSEVNKEFKLSISPANQEHSEISNTEPDPEVEIETMPESVDKESEDNLITIEGNVTQVPEITAPSECNNESKRSISPENQGNSEMSNTEPVPEVKIETITESVNKENENIVKEDDLLIIVPAEDNKESQNSKPYISAANQELSEISVAEPDPEVEIETMPESVDKESEDNLIANEEALTKVTEITAPSEDNKENKPSIPPTNQEQTEISVIEPDPEVKIDTKPENINKENKNVVKQDNLITNKDTIAQVTEITAAAKDNKELQNSTPSTSTTQPRLLVIDSPENKQPSNILIIEPRKKVEIKEMVEDVSTNENENIVQDDDLVTNVETLNQSVNKSVTIQVPELTSVAEKNEDLQTSNPCISNTQQELVIADSPENKQPSLIEMAENVTNTGKELPIEKEIIPTTQGASIENPEQQVSTISNTIVHSDESVMKNADTTTVESNEVNTNRIPEITGLALAFEKSEDEPSTSNLESKPVNELQAPLNNDSAETVAPSDTGKVSLDIATSVSLIQTVFTDVSQIENLSTPASLSQEIKKNLELVENSVNGTRSTSDIIKTYDFEVKISDVDQHKRQETFETVTELGQCQSSENASVVSAARRTRRNAKTEEHYVELLSHASSSASISHLSSEKLKKAQEHNVADIQEDRKEQIETKETKPVRISRNKKRTASESSQGSIHEDNTSTSTHRERRKVTKKPTEESLIEEDGKKETVNIQSKEIANRSRKRYASDSSQGSINDDDSRVSVLRTRRRVQKTPVEETVAEQQEYEQVTQSVSCPTEEKQVNAMVEATNAPLKQFKDTSKQVDNPQNPDLLSDIVKENQKLTSEKPTTNEQENDGKQRKSQEEEVYVHTDSVEMDPCDILPSSIIEEPLNSDVTKDNISKQSEMKRDTSLKNHKDNISPGSNVVYVGKELEIVQSQLSEQSVSNTKLSNVDENIQEEKLLCNIISHSVKEQASIKFNCNPIKTKGDSEHRSSTEIKEQNLHLSAKTSIEEGQTISNISSEIVTSSVEIEQENVDLKCENLIEVEIMEENISSDVPSEIVSDTTKKDNECTVTRRRKAIVSESNKPSAHIDNNKVYTRRRSHGKLENVTNKEILEESPETSTELVKALEPTAVKTAIENQVKSVLPEAGNIILNTDCKADAITSHQTLDNVKTGEQTLKEIKCKPTVSRLSPNVIHDDDTLRSKKSRRKVQKTSTDEVVAKESIKKDILTLPNNDEILHSELKANEVAVHDEQTDSKLSVQQEVESESVTDREIKKQLLKRSRRKATVSESSQDSVHDDVTAQPRRGRRKLQKIPLEEKVIEEEPNEKPTSELTASAVDKSTSEVSAEVNEVGLEKNETISELSHSKPVLQEYQQDIIKKIKEDEESKVIKEELTKAQELKPDETKEGLQEYLTKNGKSEVTEVKFAVAEELNAVAAKRGRRKAQPVPIEASTSRRGRRKVQEASAEVFKTKTEDHSEESSTKLTVSELYLSDNVSEEPFTSCKTLRKGRKAVETQIENINDSLSTKIVDIGTVSPVDIISTTANEINAKILDLVEEHHHEATTSEVKQIPKRRGRRHIVGAAEISTPHKELPAIINEQGQENIKFTFGAIVESENVEKMVEPNIKNKEMKSFELLTALEEKSNTELLNATSETNQDSAICQPIKRHSGLKLLKRVKQSTPTKVVHVNTDKNLENLDELLAKKDDKETPQRSVRKKVVATDKVADEDPAKTEISKKRRGRHDERDDHHLSETTNNFKETSVAISSETNIKESILQSKKSTEPPVEENRKKEIEEHDASDVKHEKLEHKESGTSSKRRVVGRKQSAQEHYGEVESTHEGAKNSVEKQNNVSKNNQKHSLEQQCLSYVATNVTSVDSNIENPEKPHATESVKDENKKRRGRRKKIDQQEEKEQLTTTCLSPEIKYKEPNQSDEDKKSIEKTDLANTATANQTPHRTGTVGRRGRKVSTIDKESYEHITAESNENEDTPSRRARNVPQRKAATVYHNYDETSDNEVQTKTKKKTDSPRKSLEASKSVPTATITSAPPTPLSSVSIAPTVTARGRTRKPTARVQQFLEEERAKAETPKRRALLAAMAGVEASTPQRTPADRSRKPSTIDTETEGTPQAAKARKRGRPPAASTNKDESTTDGTTTLVEEKKEDETHSTTPFAANISKGRRGRKAKLTEEDHKREDEPPAKKSPAESESDKQHNAPPIDVPTPTRTTGKRNAAAAAKARIEEDALAAAAVDFPKRGRAKKVPKVVTIAATDAAHSSDIANKNLSQKQEHPSNSTSVSKLEVVADNVEIVEDNIEKETLEKPIQKIRARKLIETPATDSPTLPAKRGRKPKKIDEEIELSDTTDGTKAIQGRSRKNEKLPTTEASASSSTHHNTNESESAESMEAVTEPLKRSTRSRRK